MPKYFSFEFGWDHPTKPEHHRWVEKRFDFLDSDSVIAAAVHRWSYHGEGQEVTEELEEEYGIHDYVTSGEDNIHGYSSGEVDPARIDELMEKWRQHFSTMFGLKVGPVYEVNARDEPW